MMDRVPTHAVRTINEKVNMKRDYDTIVLGLGSLGSAALYRIARRGGEVLGLEQYPIGHDKGSSQDHSRIIRLSYHTPGYVELARQAYKAWAEVEAEAGEQLIFKTGGLDLWPAEPAFPMSDYTESMAACGVGFERLSAGEIMHRWPQFRLNDDVTGIFQAEGGIATPNLSNAAHRRLATAYGAITRDNAPVESVRAVDNELELLAGGERYRCRHLVVAAGAWSNQVLTHFGRRIHLTITQEQVTYYRPVNVEEFMPERFPVWIWMDEPSFYGFPIFGESGPKAAQDVGGERVTAETRTFEPNPAALARLERFLGQVLPGMRGPHLYTKTCLYDLPPDRNFVLGILPDHPNVSLAIGAGHSFKFAALIGKILSDLAFDGHTTYNIVPFSIERPILYEENPVLNFMC
jgi:sarcosine oxidase